MSAVPVQCSVCSSRPAAIKRPADGSALCRRCFVAAFERLVHETVAANGLFARGDRVAVAASGGKDSTVLAHVLKVLNERHGYGVELLLLSVDEGIAGYRDDSLEAVKQNHVEYGLPLKVVSYDELYNGWTMDKVVRAVGRRHNCTFCGVFRRQALDRGAARLGAHKIATGHNADDLAETVLMNMLRGDVPRLIRCVDIVTGAEGSLPRCKPLKYCYEKEIVMYARFLRLTYFATECVYSPEAFRGHLRAYVKDVERVRPRAILDIVASAEQLTAASTARLPVRRTCDRCGYVTSQRLCKACLLLAGLASDAPHEAIRRTAGPESDAGGGAPSSSAGVALPFGGAPVGDTACAPCDCAGAQQVLF